MVGDNPSGYVRTPTFKIAIPEVIALRMYDELPVSEVVLIAGVGRVDAKAYRALRLAGEGMCAQVQTSCGTAWEGAPCRTARS